MRELREMKTEADKRKDFVEMTESLDEHVITMMLEKGLIKFGGMIPVGEQKDGSLIVAEFSLELSFIKKPEDEEERVLQ